MRRKIAAISLDKRNQSAQQYREDKKDEIDFLEEQHHKLLSEQKQLKQSRALKSTLDEARTYKLLSRGIPSYFYKNLNKSQC